MIGSALFPPPKLSWLVKLVSLFLLSCNATDWNERLVGDWVEDAEPNELSGPMTFSVDPDHSLMYDVNATCGTGWPKFGQLGVQDELLYFRIEGWAGRDNPYRFEFSGDSLILLGAHSRSAFYRDSLGPSI